MSGPEVHPGNVPSRPGGDHRGGLHDQNCGDRGGEDQTADLGHGRPGEVRREREEEGPWSYSDICPRFRSITQSYYRSAHALILVYDVTNQPTFDCCPDWLREIEEYASPKVLRVLVGNKIDRDDHEIPGDVGEDFANRHGMYFLQTSAKNCDNVDRLFTEIAHELLQQVTEKYFSLSPPLERVTGFTLEKIHNVLDVGQYQFQAKPKDKIYIRKSAKCNVLNDFCVL